MKKIFIGKTQLTSITKHCVNILEHGRINYRKYEGDTIDVNDKTHV